MKTQEQINESLINACIENNNTNIRKAIKDGADVNSMGGSLKTPLHHMVIKKNSEILSILLDDDRTLIDSKDTYGQTPLYYAVSSQNISFVNELINKGADVNATDRNGLNLITKAVQTLNEYTVSILCEKGADVNVADQNSKTPLCYAVENSYESIMDVSKKIALILIKHNANINYVDKNGSSILSSAITFSNQEMINLLLENGVDFARDGLICLDNAIKNKGMYFSDIAGKLLNTKDYKFINNILLKSGMNARVTHNFTDLDIKDILAVKRYIDYITEMVKFSEIRAVTKNSLDLLQDLQKIHLDRTLHRKAVCKTLTIDDPTKEDIYLGNLPSGMLNIIYSFININEQNDNSYIGDQVHYE